MTFNIIRYLLLSLLLILCDLLVPSIAFCDARIKDIVNFEGIRENILVGYGIIVGLNGTGDNLKNAAFTEKGLTDFLEKLGINTKGANLKTKNVSAVMVTATLHAFARTGSKISVNVNTLGDTKSLKGGTLLATTLLGADGEVYAIAQGPISIGELSDGKDGKNVQKVNPTAGYISNGAIIEREINFDLNSLKEIKCALKNPDITTARTIATTINSVFGKDISKPLDPGTVVIKIPSEYQNNVLSLLADIETSVVYTDTIAKIIIDEATGTIVMGDNVRISPVAVAQGNLIAQVKKDDDFISELLLGSKGKLKSLQDPGKEIEIIDETATLQDLVQGLNALGVSPKDLVAILKSIKDAGALQAEIVVQ